MPTPPHGTQWRRVRLRPFIRLMHEVPVRLRWQYRFMRHAASQSWLCLVSPRGVWWHLKLDKGIHITRIDPPKGGQRMKKADGRKKMGVRAPKSGPVSQSPNFQS